MGIKMRKESREEKEDGESALEKIKLMSTKRESVLCNSQF